MAKSDRLLLLMQLMRELPKPFTARQVAERLEVSERTVYRDIEALRATGVAIDGDRGLGYHLSEDYLLPPQTFTRAELEALVIGLSEVTHLADTTLGSAASSALAKINAILPSDRERFLMHAVSRVRRASARLPASAFVDDIREACWHEVAIRIQYQDKQQQLSEREIYPLSLVYMERVLILLAWCCLRQDFRMFRLDAISEVTRTQHSFAPKRVNLLRQYIERLEQEGNSA